MAFPKSRGLLLVIVLILTLGDRIYSKFVFNVSSCPTCKEDWKRRSDKLKCDANKTLSYHCIINSEDQLIETCMTKTKILPNTEGCPRVVVYTDGLAYHDFVFSDCLTNNTYCPRNHTGYWTDELYMYPICFLKESDRPLYQEDDCQGQTTVQINRSDHIAADPNYMPVILSLLGVAITVIFLALIWKRIRKKYGTTEGGYCSKSFVNNVLCPRKQEEGPSDERINLMSSPISEHLDLIKFILLDTIADLESPDRHVLAKDTSCEFCKKMDPVLFAAEISRRKSFTYMAEKLNFKFRDNEMAMRILCCCMRNEWIDLAKKIIVSHSADEEKLNATVQYDNKGYLVVPNKEMKNVLQNLKGQEILIMDDLNSNEKWQEMMGQYQNIQSLIFMT